MVPTRSSAQATEAGVGAGAPTGAAPAERASTEAAKGVAQEQVQEVQDKSEQPKAAVVVGRVPSAGAGSRAGGSHAESRASDGAELRTLDVAPEVYKAEVLHKSLCVGYQKELNTPPNVPIAEVAAPELDD